MVDPVIQHLGQGVQWPPKGTSFEPVTKFQSISEIDSDVVVWTPKSGHKIILAGIILSGEASNNITLKGLVRGIFNVISLSDIDKFDHAGSQPIWVGQINEQLVIDTSTTGQSFLTLYGHEDS